MFMEPVKRRSFFSQFFGGAAVTAVAVAPVESEVKNLDDGKMALAELKPDREYLLFCDPTRVDFDGMGDALSADGGVNANVRIIPSIARSGHPVADNVALYSVDRPAKNK